MKIIGWTSFDSDCQGICVKDREIMVEALNELVREIAEKGYLFSGETHQSEDYCVPVFDNGKCLKCSMRAWAMIMSIAHTGKEANYMDYYMDQFIKENNIPTQGVSEDSFVIDLNDHRLLYYYSNQDLSLVAESASAGMPLMTFDKVVLVLYDIISEYLKNQENNK